MTSIREWLQRCVAKKLWIELVLLGVVLCILVAVCAKRIRFEIVSYGGSPNQLLGYLKDSDHRYRMNAIDRIGDLGDEQALGPLAEVLRIDESGFVRLAAIQAIGKIGGVQAVGLLLEYIQAEVSKSEERGRDRLACIQSIREITSLALDDSRKGVLEDSELSRIREWLANRQRAQRSN